MTPGVIEGCVDLIWTSELGKRENTSIKESFAQSGAHVIKPGK